MADIPVQGTPGVWDYRNPTLVPNLDYSTAGTQDTLTATSPAAFLALYPRANASETATIGGSATSGDTIELTFTAGTLPGGSFSVTYTVQSTDTLDTIAEGLADLVNATAAAIQVGLTAELGGTGESAEIVFNWNGPVGNYCLITDTLSGGATETVTYGNGGQLAGGSGPVIAFNNFTWHTDGGTSNFWAGKPVNIGYDQITKMVAQGMPIV